MKHIITMLVENQPGVLARIVGLISGRGFNIDTLNVAPTHDPTVSRMTIQVLGDDRILEQVTKQLNKQIDVIKVSDLTSEPHVDRELVLVRIGAPAQRLAEVRELAAMAGARVVSLQPGAVMLEMCGDQRQIEEFLGLARPFRILDMTRSGAIAMGRGELKEEKRKGAES